MCVLLYTGWCTCVHHAQAELGSAGHTPLGAAKRGFAPFSETNAELASGMTAAACLEISKRKLKN